MGHLLPHTRQHLVAAAVFATAAAAWGIAGAVLPGGRWLAVHLLALGVLTNLLAGLMPHFTQTVLHAGVDDGGRSSGSPSSTAGPCWARRWAWG